MTERATERPAAGRPRAERRLGAALFLLVVVIFPFSMVTLLANDVDSLSVLDEFAHVDVLRRVEDVSYPRLGERILPATARDIGCRGIGGREVGTCEEPPPIEKVDAKGYNFQAQQPPGYYIPSAIARQVTAVFVDDFVLSARLTGMFWLVGGLAVLWLVLRRLGIDLWARAATVALIAASPLVLFQSATVTNDATLILLGSVLAYAAHRLDERSSWLRALGIGVVAAVAVVIKPTALLGVGALSLAVVLRELFRRGRPWSLPAARTGVRVVLVAAVPSIFALGANSGWESIRDERAVTPFDQVFDVVLGASQESESVTLGEAVELSGRFLGAYANTTQGGAPNDRDYTSGLAQIGFVLLVAGPASALVLGSDRRTAIGVAALVVAVGAAIASVYEYHSTYGIEGGAPGRYALILLPFFGLALGGLVDRRPRSAAVVGIVAGALMVADVISVLAL